MGSFPSHADSKKIERNLCSGFGHSGSQHKWLLLQGGPNGFLSFYVSLETFHPTFSLGDINPRGLRTM
jgi:hypothetical protein